MDFSETLEQMLAAARKAAGSHWNDIHSYFENEMLIAKQDALRLTLEVMHGSKLPAQANIEAEQIKDSLHDVENALAADLKAAAQDAVNAALKVLGAAVNAAVKFPLF